MAPNFRPIKPSSPQAGVSKPSQPQNAHQESAPTAGPATPEGEMHQLLANLAQIPNPEDQQFQIARYLDRLRPLEDQALRALFDAVLKEVESLEKQGVTGREAPGDAGRAYGLALDVMYGIRFRLDERRRE